MSSRAVDLPDWALFADWCEATQSPALPTTLSTVAAFLADLDCAPSTARRRAHVIFRVHTEEACPLPRDVTEPMRPWRDGQEWSSVSEALTATPTVGWPAGLRGRRDALVVVLAGELGYRRGQIRTIQPARIALDDGVTVDGHTVSRANGPPSCPACAITRWLRVVTLTRLGGRADAQRLLTDARTPTDDGPHDCDTPVPESWRTVRQLLPAIDRHGWVDDWRPISRRTISTIVADRQTPTPSPRRTGEPSSTADNADSTAVDTEEDPPVEGEPSRFADHDMDDLLDMLEEAATAALKRSEAALKASSDLVDYIETPDA